MLASRVFRVVYKDVVLFPQKKKNKLQFTHLWFDENLSCITVV